MSSNAFDVTQLIGLLLPQLPLLLAWTVGVVLAMVNLKRHPRVAALFLIAMVLLIGQAVGGTLAWHWLLRRMETGAWTSTDFGTQSMIVNLVRVGFQTAAWLLVFMAVFSGRQQLRRYDPREEPLPVSRSAPRLGVDLPPDSVRD